MHGERRGNLMELLETVARQKRDDEEVTIHLVTHTGDFDREPQEGFLDQIQTKVGPIGILFSWEFAPNTDARHIITDLAHRN